MKHRHVERRKDVLHPEGLLDLWMGQTRENGTREARVRRTGPMLFVTAVLILATVGMAKYAVDVLAIVVVLVTVGVALHVLGLRLAESDLLSPGWFTIIVLGMTLFAYAWLVPANSVAGVTRYMPKWMVSALEWSESKGWGQRVLVGPGDSGRPTPTVGTDSADSHVSTRGSTSSPLVLTASGGTTLHGQPVTLMARLDGEDRVGGRASVRFYAGGRLLGIADLKRDGRTNIAYLTVRGLAVGNHDVEAELVGTLGAGGLRSMPLRHTVLPRTR